MRNFHLGMMVLVACVAVNAQTAGGPRLGWLSGGEGGKVRAMEGVPGAGRMGAEASLRAGWTLLAMNPRESWAVVVDGEGRAGIWRLGAEGEVEGLEGAAGNVRAARWSPLGKAMALIGETGEAQIWVEREGRYELAGEVKAGTREVAVSDDGGQVAAIEGGVLVIYRDGGRYAVAESEDGAQISFIADSRALVQVSAGWLRVYEEGTETARGQIAGGGRVMVASPAAGVVVTVTGGEQSMVRTWNAQAELKSEVGCPVEVRAIGAVGRASTLRLEGGGGGTIWMVEAGGGEARVFFVPPAVEMSEGGEQ